MSSTIKKMFMIRDLINTSSTPLNTEQISKALDIGLRTVQRYTMTLANQGLIGIKGVHYKTGYDYTKKDTGEVFRVNRNSNGYLYYKLGEERWNLKENF